MAMALVPATVPTLAARALRKLGVAPVVAANLPANTDIATPASIVTQALRDLGVNPVGTVTGPTGTAVVADLAAQALRAIGLNPIAQSAQTQTATNTHTQAQLASLALQQVQVNLGGAGAPDGTVVTLATVATKALIFLNIQASDETPAAADQAEALSWATAFHDNVIQAGYGAWSASAIPAAVSNLYAIGIAAQLAPAFEKPADPQGYAGAMQGIKAIGLAGTAGQTYAVDQVQQVHAMLVGKNLANWAITAVPDAVVEYYVLLASQEMCRTFGQQFDPAAYNGGMAGIRRYAYSGALGQALAEAKITQVHEALNALNLTGWVITAIPTAVSDAYIQMAAFLLEPMLEKQPDLPQLYTQATWDAAVGRVRAVVLSGSYAVTIATAELTQIQDSLIGANLVTWDISHIPAGAADSYSVLLADNLAPTFGKQADGKAGQAARDQVTQFSLLLASQPLAEQVLRGVHAEWRARGITRWEIFSIPRELEEAYVCASAYRLGPQFPQRLFPGLQFDKGWEQGAEHTVFQMIALRPTAERVVAEYF